MAPAKTAHDPLIETLIRDAKSKDGRVSRDALSDLLARLYPRLLQYLRRLTADNEAAKDCCQETMVRIVTHLPRFTPVPGVGAWSSFQAWAFTIAGNTYKDYLRRSAWVIPVAGVPESGRRPAAGRPGSAPVGGRPHDGAGSPAAESEALARIGFASLMEALAGLPAEQRQVFLLKAYYGYSYRDVAAIARCPEGTAKSRLHHAVRALRERLKGSGTV